MTGATGEESVLVIGAGPAGLASAHYLERAGIRYRVVDRADVIASTWASLYPSLRLNTTRFFSHLPGQKFPLRWGVFPTGRQYHAYLVEYARRGGFNIQLGVEVIHAAPEGDGWRVEMRSAQGTESAWFLCVIAATGRFNAPFVPPFPGLDQFEGVHLHARDYAGPEPFRDRRVLVVGNGPSGIDIAAELGDYAARPVLLAQRTGVILKRRYPYGLPKHAWMILAEKLPPALRRRVEAIGSAPFRGVERYGIKTPPPSVESTAAGGARGAELIRAVKAGKVRPVDAPRRFYPRAVELTDGSRHDLDAVIFGTGYRPVLYQYIDLPDVAIDRHGWPLRDCSKHPDGREVIGYPGLYLVGVFYQGKGAMFNFHVEAAIAVQQIQARLYGAATG
jgi:cation diffusion facilitator CzcD-associated flavoprotein CzcO